MLTSDDLCCLVQDQTKPDTFFPQAHHASEDPYVNHWPYQFQSMRGKEGGAERGGVDGGEGKVFNCWSFEIPLEFGGSFLCCPLLLLLLLVLFQQQPTGMIRRLPSISFDPTRSKSLAI